MFNCKKHVFLAGLLTVLGGAGLAAAASHYVSRRRRTMEQAAKMLLQKSLNSGESFYSF